MKRKMFRLYARPSFWEGIGRLLDARAVLNEYNNISSARMADFRALRSDWEIVGADLGKILHGLEKNTKGKRKK
jgi:hypothetical protein